jgi:hypothetical protein
MSEPKDHWQITDAGGVLVLDLHFTTAASQLEDQIHSTGR